MHREKLLTRDCGQAPSQIGTRARRQPQGRISRRASTPLSHCSDSVVIALCLSRVLPCMAHQSSPVPNTSLAGTPFAAAWS